MELRIFLGGVLVTGIAAGVLSRWWLRKETHRRPEERELPARSQVWVAVLMPVMAVLAALGAASRWPWWVAVGPAMFVMAWLVAAGVDADVGRLPDRMTLPLAALAVVWAHGFALVFQDWDALVRSVLGGIGLGSVYFALVVLSRLIPPHREGLGAGDAKLALSIGAVLGWFSWHGVWASFLCAFFIGAVWGVVLLVRRRAQARDSFSFGPAMALGAALAFVVA